MAWARTGRPASPYSRYQYGLFCGVSASRRTRRRRHVLRGFQQDSLTEMGVLDEASRTTSRGSGETGVNNQDDTEHPTSRLTAAGLPRFLRCSSRSILSRSSWCSSPSSGPAGLEVRREKHKSTYVLAARPATSCRSRLAIIIRCASRFTLLYRRLTKVSRFTISVLHKAA